MANDSTVNVICMKWGTKYDAANVNRTRAMVRRHLSLPHRFVLFTDDGTGVGNDVEVLPLPKVTVPDGPERCWRKLGVFSSQETTLRGLTLFLDLDLVLMDSIDCFFELPGDFCIIRDWLRGQDGGGNSSVFRFDAEKQGAILETFESDVAAAVASVRHEQAWISRQVDGLTYWPESWCRSFKRHCLQPFPVNLIKPPHCPPDTKILVFHGDPKPEVAASQMTMKLQALRFSRPAHWLTPHLEAR